LVIFQDNLISLYLDLVLTRKHLNDEKESTKGEKNKKD